MSAKILGESVTFRIEVEDKPLGILLVLDRKCNFAMVSWQDAVRLADAMIQVTRDVQQHFTPTSHAKTMEEQAQVLLNHHKGLVAFMWDWTDRIWFTSLDAFYLVAMGIKRTAQDAYMDEEKELNIFYNKQGMISSLYNRKLGTTQEVR
jgi:hypothetical protein